MSLDSVEQTNMESQLTMLEIINNNRELKEQF